MATSRGIWLPEPIGSAAYDDVLTSLVDVGATITDVQAAVLRFIAQYGSGGGSSVPTTPVSVSFAALTGVPSDSPALTQALTTLASQLRNEITSGVGPAYEALQSITAQLTNSQDAGASLLNAIANRLRIDAAQNLNDTQKAFGLLNLGINGRLLPTGATQGQVPILAADGTWVPGFVAAVSTPVDPAVTSALALTSKIATDMRLRIISIGNE